MAVLMLGLSAPGYSQVVDSLEDFIKLIDNAKSSSDSALRSFSINVKEAQEGSIAIRKKLETAQLHYIDSQIHAMTHREKAFAWQLVSTKIIFFFVISLCATGVYFSWVQFKRGMEKKPSKVKSAVINTSEGEEQSAVKEAQVAVTELEISTSGLKVSSPILGIIILALSLAFLYLYLVYVYGIEELSTSNPPNTTEQGVILRSK